MTRVGRAGVVAGVLCTLLVGSLVFVRGALFPWSPVRPGYVSVEHPRTTLVFPAGSRVPDDARDTDGVMAEVEAAVGLRFRSRVTVVATRDWGLFNRGGLLRLGAEPVPVLGSALQTGTVVYLSPTAWEAGRDMRAVLRHELVHALLFQQMPLSRTFELVKLDWFEEGLAVRFGNPGDYFGDGEWGRLARRPEYRFGPEGDWELRHVPEELRGPFRLAEYRLYIEFLVHRHGTARFAAWRDRVLADPPRHPEAFLGVFGESREEANTAFERAVREGRWPAPAPGGKE